MFNHLEWLVDIIKKNGGNTLKNNHILQWNFDGIGTVNYLLLGLGGAACSPDDSQASDQCLIGIYHSLTLKHTNKELLNLLKMMERRGW